MTTTVTQERILAEQNSNEGIWAVFKGRNLIRFVIASWPKIVQQFVGLSVFNTYATYFCKSPTWCHFPACFLADRLDYFQSNMPETRTHSESLLFFHAFN
jgi:hypothetical protein